MKKILLAGLMLMAICRPAMAESKDSTRPSDAVEYFNNINKAMVIHGPGNVDTGSTKKCFDFMFAQFGNCEFRTESAAWRRVMEWREDFYKAYAAYKKPHNAQNAINACNVLNVYFPGTMQERNRIENDFDCNRCGARAMLYYLCGASLYKLASQMPEGVDKESKLQNADELCQTAADEWARNIERNGADELKATANFRVFMKMVNAH